VSWNVVRLITQRWKRYGRAALVIGEPWPVSSWFADLEAKGVQLFALERHERLGYVQAFADRVMKRIGSLMPVTSVALTCAALETFTSEYVAREQLLDRMADLREVLKEHSAFVLRHESDVSETFDRAYRMLRMRRVIAEQGTGYLVLPKGRALIHYYASSIRHLYEPYLAGIAERDQRPAYRGISQ
jgi:glycerol-3-phosphate O-acyltransferase